MKPKFVWLGAKRARKRGVGNKGSYLDEAAKVGLPVPNGAVLLDELYQFALEEGIISVTGKQVVAQQPDGLHALLYDFLRFPRLGRKVAVRSAFAAEDTADASLAGYFSSVLQVDFSDPGQISQSLCEVWSSALRHDEDFRRDVLVLAMVAAEVAGVAFTERPFEDDLINFSQGTADKLVSGTVAGETLSLPKLSLWEQPTADLPPFAQRLQRLLRGVRRTFGHKDWDVEWADDGRICWLIQLRPITRPTRRNEAFTFANLREILPDPPSPFMTSIVAAASRGFFEYYRQFDPSLPSNREMVQVFAGRPLFNVSLLTEMMRQWGLPTALVTNSLGGEGDVEVGLRLGRFLRHTAVLLKLGWAQLTAVNSARRATENIRQQIDQNPEQLKTFTEASALFQSLFTQFVTEMFTLTQALSGPLLLLRLSHTLGEHSSRQRTIGTQLFLDLLPLRGWAASHPEAHADLTAGQPPGDPQFQQLWQAFLNKHGHRAIYESDIARPRYREAPEPLLQSILQPPTTPPAPPPPYSLKARLTLPLWWQCSRVMTAREQWRYDSIKAYETVRLALLALAETAVARHQLPTKDALWLLTQEEASALDNGAVYDTVFIASRQRELDDLKTFDLPDLLHRFDDLEAYRRGNVVASANGRSRLQGVSLTTGTVNGRAWVLQEPSMQLPSGFNPVETILVARSVDPGWIPTFSLVAGVVVEIGGDLSHGSIILREIGLPAITNVRQATRQIQTGDALTLRAEVGSVVKSAL